MVELLIVIMIISVLATLIMLSIPGVRNGGGQHQCSTNVRVILQGIRSYSSISGQMPIVPVSGSESAPDWDVAIGTNRTVSPFSDAGGNDMAPQPRNHSSNLWLLVREAHVALEAFVCPGTDDIINRDEERPSEFWDFASARNISYGMQSPYGWDESLPDLTPIGVVLVADGSPYVQPYGASSPGKVKTGKDLVIQNWAGDSSEDKRFYGNSPNHDSEGQNVGYGDGHVVWQPAANCGKDGDNIYTANGYADPRKARVETSPGGKLGTEYRNNPNDTVILP